MKDRIFGDIEFNNKGSWKKSMDKSLYGSDVALRLLVQDENQEGILDVQREAFQTYMGNEAQYINEVPRYLLDYYKWHFEEIDKIVELEDDKQKDTITESVLFRMCKVFFLFICRDGSFGWILGSSWCKEGFAVLLSEPEPRVLLTRNEIRYLHKLSDPAFGTLIHDNKKYWTTWDKLTFYDETIDILVEAEGSETEGINETQQKVYTQYLQNKDEYLKKLSEAMLPIYLGDKKEAKKIIASGQRVGVKTIIPKRLVIDKKGNFGWICYTEWDGSYIGVLLSEEEIYFMETSELRDFEQEEKVKDKVFGYLFHEFHGWGKTEIVRFFKDDLQTLHLTIRTYDENVNDEQRKRYKEYLQYKASFWDGIKDELLTYYLKFYNEFSHYLDIPDSLKKENVTRDNVVSILTFTKLFITKKGRIAWLCESPTEEEDGLAFEFTDGKIKQIFQPEII
ncbi:MAG: hypothetical protein J5767_00630 [Paludibacteraceae bacterium]|nr:hypothetical protein [Paludibacteraceae bacterium]